MGVADQLVQTELGGVAVQQSEADFFAKTTRQRVDTKINRLVFVSPANTTVLRLAPFGDVQVRQDVEAGGYRWNESSR